MTERDHHAYRRLYQLIINDLPHPDLLIYIQASVPTLLTHIQQRGRSIEENISPDYLTRLNRFYDEWITGFDHCPVLTVPGDQLDFVRYPNHLTIIAERVQDKLAGKAKVEFPSPEELNAR
jgi:hypothetical protein